MVDKELVNYVKRALVKGVSLGEIKKSLTARGWAEKEIIEAMSFSSPGKSAGKSSKLWLVFVLILVVIIVLGVLVFFVLNGGEKKEKPSIEEEIKQQYQTSDFGEFIESSINCEKATFNNVAFSIIPDIYDTKTTYLYSIDGAEGDKCLVSIKTEKVELIFKDGWEKYFLPADATAEQIEQKKQEFITIAKSREDETGLCKFNQSDLTEVLNRWKESRFLYEDWNIAECSGNFFGK